MTEPQQSASSAEALKGKRGLRRLINATGYSIKGIRAGLEHEAAFREEFLLAVILIPTALFFAGNPARKSASRHLGAPAFAG